MAWRRGAPVTSAVAIVVASPCRQARGRPGVRLQADRLREGRGGDASWAGSSCSTSGAPPRRRS
eukprot:9708507-Alexandrium_andersonii.AAC.1